MNSKAEQSSEVVHVAVGVIFDKDDKILIARRHDHLHQGGLWEFPGGKVECGENVQMALARELREELSIQIQSIDPLIRIPYQYSDKHVLLDVWRVNSFTGEPHGKEEQPIRRVSVEELSTVEFPAANRAIVNAVRLPRRYLVTGEFVDIDDFSSRLQTALRLGIRLVQLRCKQLSYEDLLQLTEITRKICDEHGAQVLLNGAPEAVENLPYDGVHLDGQRLHSFNSRPIADNRLLGVSLHAAADIQQAMRIGADFGVLSPVCATRSHPQTLPLGWERFAEMVELAGFPIYALGGMTTGDEMTALRNGAQGIAAISAFWNPM